MSTGAIPPLPVFVQQASDSVVRDSLKTSANPLSSVQPLLLSDRAGR